MSSRARLTVLLAAVVALAATGALTAGEGRDEGAVDPRLAVEQTGQGDRDPGGSDPSGLAEGGGSRAVSSLYAFSSSVGTYTPIAGGTSLTTSCDDTSYTNQPIGFTFSYDGTAYTAFSVNCNGFLALGTTVSSSYSPLSSGSTNNVIAAIGMDQQTGTSGSEIRYETVGAAPDRVLVVQWTNFRYYAATGDSFNYQIRLYETSNRVEVVYGAFTKNSSARTPQVGLRGASSADFNNRDDGPAGSEWTASVPGASNTAAMPLNPTVYPADGLTYAWYIAPVLNYSASTVDGETCTFAGGPAEDDGVVDPGETVDLSVTLSNTGVVGATGVSATLTSPTPGVSIVSGSASYPDIPAGGTGTSTTAYQFEVGLLFPCGRPIVLQLAITSNEASFTRSFTLDVGTGTVVYAEGFDTAAPPALPAGWAMVRTAGTNTAAAWATATGTVHPTGGGTHSAPNLAYFNSYTVNSPNAARLYQDPTGVDLTATAGQTVVVQLWMYHDTGYTANDTVQVQLSTDAGATWGNVGAAIPRYDGSVGWKRHSVDASSYAGLADVRLGFNATSAYGNDCHVDDVAVVAYDCNHCYGLLLDPGFILEAGCHGVERRYMLHLHNYTGAAGTFDLDYDVLSANATAVGPATVVAADGEVVEVEVALTPDACLAEGEMVNLRVDAVGNGFNTTSMVNHEILGEHWSYRAGMLNPRGDLAVVGYGDSLYAIGGSADGTAGTTIGRNQRFDTFTNTWEERAPMPTPLTIIDGAALGPWVVIPGGRTAAGAVTAETWLYDPAGDAWLAGPPAPRAVQGYAAATCGPWVVRVGGQTGTGNGTTGFEVFDGVNWIPGPAMIQGHWWPFMGCVGEYVVVAGGIDGTGVASSFVEYYDLTAFPTGPWAPGAPLPATWWGGADFVLDGALYVAGGIRNGVTTRQAAFFPGVVDPWDPAPQLEEGRFRLEGDVAGGYGYADGGWEPLWVAHAANEVLAECPQCADLWVTKDDGVDEVTPGDAVTYTIVVGNAGPADASDALVEDVFPAALTGVSWTCDESGGGTCGDASGTDGILQVIQLPAGTSVSYVVSATVDAAAAGTLANTVTVAPRWDNLDPDPSNDSATDTDTVLLPPTDLAITKTDGVTSVVPGEEVTYTITVTNNGPADIPGANVVDDFPLALVSPSWACDNGASGSGDMDVDVDLANGQTVTCTVVATVDPAATGVLDNTATVAMPAGVTDPTPDNNSATDSDTLTPEADLAVTKTDGVTVVQSGGHVTYTITVGNAGSSNCPTATVGDSFPSQLETVDWTCAGAGGGACTASGSGNINDTTVVLPAGAQVVYTADADVSVTARGVDVGGRPSLVNTATAFPGGGVPDPDLGNNSSTDVDELSSPVDLSVVKDDGQTEAVAGMPITYTITVANAGPATATDAVVTDAFPAAISGVVWTCVAAGGGSCGASGTGNLIDFVTLPAGATATYTATGTLAATATGTVVNTAAVSVPAGVVDLDTGNNSSTDTDTVVASADLSVNKESEPITFQPGDPLSYTIVVENAGPSAVVDATVADVMPVTLLAVSWSCAGAGGGTCTASGAGDINDATVDLPVGASVTYTVSATIDPAATGWVINTATAAVPAGVTDPEPANDSATHVDALGPDDLFSDGFETGDASAWIVSE